MMNTKRIYFSLALMAACAAIMGLECFLKPVRYFELSGRYWWQDAIIALWPLIMGGLALSLSRLMMCFKKNWLCLLYPAYFALAGLGIMGLGWHHIPWRAYELSETVYLILAADIALWCVTIDGLMDWETSSLLQYIRPGGKKLLLTKRLEICFFSAGMKRARLISTAAANIAALALLVQHDRVWDILFGRAGLAGWLGYRGGLLIENIGGLEPVSFHSWEAAVNACPLSRIAVLNGLWVMLGMLTLVAAAFALIFLLKGALPKEHVAGYLFSAVAFSLLARSCIGLLCDAFLVSSAQVQVLLLGKPWDIISIAALLALVLLSVKNKEKEEYEYRQWFRLGPLKAMDAAVPPSAAHAQGGAAPGKT